MLHQHTSSFPALAGGKLLAVINGSAACPPRPRTENSPFRGTQTRWGEEGAARQQCFMDPADPEGACSSRRRIKAVLAGSKDPSFLGRAGRGGTHAALVTAPVPPRVPSPGVPSVPFARRPRLPLQLRSPEKWLYSVLILISPWIPRAPQTQFVILAVKKLKELLTPPGKL